MGSCITRIEEEYDNLKDELLPLITLFEEKGEIEKANEIKARLKKADPKNGPINISNLRGV